MQLDMGKAWTSATTMIGSNRDTVLAVAGLFFFLPYFALALLAPEAVAPTTPATPADPSDSQAMIDAAIAAATQQYADYWWAFLIITVLQTVGMLALLSLLTDRSRPTVGEALRRGAKGLLTYLAAQILMVIVIALGVGLPLALLSLIGLGILAAFLVFPLIIYLFIKFSLTPAVIAIEQQLNPLAVLTRSWQLTKGNSLRLFLFLFLLIIAVGIVALLTTLVAGTVFAAMGATAEQIGNGFVSGVVNAVFAVIFLAVFAAVHRQLAGPDSAEVSEMFE